MKDVSAKISPLQGVRSQVWDEVEGSIDYRVWASVLTDVTGEIDPFAFRLSEQIGQRVGLDTEGQVYNQVLDRRSSETAAWVERVVQPVRVWSQVWSQFQHRDQPQKPERSVRHQVQFRAADRVEDLLLNHVRGEVTGQVSQNSIDDLPLWSQFCVAINPFLHR